MADLTDSYCERCGTRYSFTEAAPKGFSLKGARVLAKGLRNFVLTDGQSMSDAIENARLETNTESSSRVTEAFHATFNFCMVCRQYACSKCWNVKVGACLSCAPETNVRSVSPEDHLIVRTPVARWDGDWAITPDGPVIEALLGQDKPAPTKPQRMVPPPFATPDAADGGEWSGVDLLEQQMAAISKAKVAREAQQNKRAEPDPGTLWAAVNMTEAAVQPNMPAALALTRPAPTPPASPTPTTDSPPEMALTPQELMLIRAELSPNDDFPPPTFVDHRETPSPREVAAQWLSVRQAGAAPIPQSTEQTRPARSFPPAPAPLPGSLPPFAPTLHASTRERTPIAKIPARRGDQQAAKAHGRRRGTEAVEPWPHATPWAERSLAAHNEWLRSQEESQVESQVEGPLLAQPHVRQPRAASSAPVAPAAVASNGLTGLIGSPPEQAAGHLLAVTHSRQSRTPADTGARGAPSELIGAEPAPTYESGSSETAAQARPKKSKPAAAEMPAWPEADTEVAEAVSRRLGAIAAGSPVPALPAQGSLGQIPTAPVVPATAAEPAHPWPPLGSRYTQRPRVEELRSIPAPQFAASLAAQPAPPQLDEMWAQSSQEVIDSGTIRVCGRCSLPVSTQARFCRRCGTPQA